MFNVYQPSGAIGFKTLPLIIAGIFLTIVLAFVYQFLLEWIPLIYVNFLLTLGMGIGVGMIGSFVVKSGHCRNWLIAGLVGMIFFLSGLGAKYWFQYQRMTQELVGLWTEQIESDPNIPATEKESELDFRKQNFTFLMHIGVRVNQGWVVGKGNGAPLSGIFVYVIWLIEAGIIGYFAVTAPVATAKEPYSEKMIAWADEAQVVMTLPITDPEMVSKIESASSVDDLLEIPIPINDQSTQFAIYTVNSIPGEEFEDAYLSVDLITYSVNKKGEQETKTRSLVAHAVMSADKRKQLIENAELLQEAIAEYRASLLEDAAKLESHDEKSGDA